MLALSIPKSASEFLRWLGVWLRRQSTDPGLGKCPFPGSMDRCMLTFRAVDGSTASRPVAKQYDNADPNMMRHQLAG
jgi:hypothetical protein